MAKSIAITDEKVQPSLHISSDDIKNIKDFGLEDKVEIRAYGKINDLSFYGEGKSKTENMGIKLFDIKISAKGDEDTEDLLKERSK